MKTSIKNLFTRLGGASRAAWACLGVASMRSRVLPALIAGLGLIPVGRVQAVSPGTVVAWGYNAYGQTNVPAGLSGVVTAIAAGGYHTVALKTNGTVVAWGDNSYGQTNVP